jgi:two-component system sensor histidine kinase KdpD
VEGTYKFAIKNDKGTLDIDSPATLIENKERVTALWAFENNHEAGWSTDTLPFSENLYIPLKGPHEVMGLLIYKSPAKRMLTIEERNLIYSMCQQISNYLEKSSSE